MGGVPWDESHYKHYTAEREAAGFSALHYDDSIKAGKAEGKVHELMLPNRKPMIESRDSTAHPNSNAVAFLLDVTGSGGEVPRIVRDQLPQFMRLMIQHNYLPDPQMLIGAFGDATAGDRGPLQIGEFETDAKIADVIGQLWIEHGGGPGAQESYELAMWFMLNRTALDCMEKRHRRGYLFIVGDEMAYENVSQSQVASIIGATIQGDIPTADVVRDLKAKYNCHYIICSGSAHYHDNRIRDHWVQHFGEENFHRLQDPADICAFTAGLIGLTEGSTDSDRIATDLAAAGYTADKAGSVSKELATFGAARGPAATDVALPDQGTGSGVATL